ncbi:MAG TPA: replication-associated recombination protein A [Coxiellaceae bacterium]|nr:replication-associated recombination protein A [Coxiellaceae bacterium]
MYEPLASRMRPRTIEEYIGQFHLVGEGRPLRELVNHGRLHSMIFWGPPGCGKTTLAYLLAGSIGARTEKMSAVLAGVKDIRAVVDRAKTAQQEGQLTILFVDEVHRFNKAQQDAFLPHVEAGTLILIGATTENPSFQLNNALLSRARVYVLKPLTEEELRRVLEQALQDKEKGLGHLNLTLELAVKDQLIHFSDGDARQLLNYLEMLSDLVDEKHPIITTDMAEKVLAGGLRRFDKQGEVFYDQISALHKSMRGSDPDASLYWLSRMLEAGCDPDYVCRRVVRTASEDVGNADPRALSVALEAWQTYERLGDQEGLLALAQAVVYIACAPKSNAVYKAFNAAWKDAQTSGSLEVPLYLRNAPTTLMKELGYGKAYRYAHDEAEAFAAGVNYFPEKMSAKCYYKPVARGLEIKIKEKLDHLRQLNQQAKAKI